MDGYLKRRLSNPVYGSGAMNESSAYKRFAFEQSVEEQKPTDSHPLQMVRYNASAKKMHCWEGYERTPGTVAGTDGSCRKKGSKKKKKSGEKKKKEKKDGDKSSSESSDSDDEHKKKSKD